jgi:uncharacterized protein (TIGR02118 family)
MLSRREFGLGAAAAGAMAAVSPGAAKAAAGAAMSLNVLYPRHEGARFDLAYYRATHIPLAMEVMKADKVMLTEGVPSPNGPAPFVMIAQFQFASADALQAATAHPRMAEVRADVAKFTDIKPTVMLGQTA